MDYWLFCHRLLKRIIKITGFIEKNSKISAVSRRCARGTNGARSVAKSTKPDTQINTENTSRR